ncbi:hypothetical protein T484DRAFT_2954803 [Baffinella frigidus]|nr:hypothetical protein T484DRAFT_2954803 [Cryptophyta sp. CCMP2293]
MMMAHPPPPPRVVSPNGSETSTRTGASMPTEGGSRGQTPFTPSAWSPTDNSARLFSARHLDDDEDEAIIPHASSTPPRVSPAESSGSDGSDNLSPMSPMSRRATAGSQPRSKPGTASDNLPTPFEVSLPEHREQTFIQLMTSDHTLKASREGSN